MVARARLLASLFVVIALAPVARATSSFVEFESGQVRPLALSPDGTHLFAVDTPDNRLEIFDVDLTTGNLTHSDLLPETVPVGLEPVAVAARTNTEVWVVNHLSDSVSIVDLSGSQPRVRQTLLVGDEPRDIVFALGGTRAFITCAHRGQQRTDSSIAGVPGAVDPQLTTPGVGRADVWTFDATNPGTTPGGTPLSIVTLFGDTPRALAVSNDGNTVYAGVFHSGNQTTTVNEKVVCDGGNSAGSCPVNGVTYPGGLPAPNQDANGVTGPETGLVLKFNGSHWVDTLGRTWDNAVRFSLPDDDIFRIDATASPPRAIPSTPHDGKPFAHVGTVIFNMVVNPAPATNPTTGALRDHIYVTNGDERNDVRFEGQRSPCGSPTSVVGHLSEARITVLDPVSGSVTPRHLNKHLDSGASSYCTVPSPAGTADASLSTPVGMAVTSDGATLYVAAFGSSDPASPGTGGQVGVFSTTQLEANTFTPSLASHILLSGGGASGLVLNEAAHRLYVMTRFDNAVSVVDTSSSPGSEIQHLPIHNPEPAVVTDGRKFLYDATLTSSNGEAACASCHIFGDFDSLAWDLGDPSGTVLTNRNLFRLTTGENKDFHSLKGPMTTQTLRGMVNDGPMHWRGDRTVANDPPPNNDPVTNPAGDFEKFNVAFVGLIGLPGHCSVTTSTPCQRNANCPTNEACVGLSDAAMQAFADFILEVMLPPNPVRTLKNSLTGTPADAGKTFFNMVTSDTVQTCNGCHVLDAAHSHFGTDGMSSFESETQDFKIPHLRNLYQKIGMFGFPNVAPFIGATGDATLPAAGTFMDDQVRGFGFLHDGSVDTIFRFHNAGVFTNGFNNGATNAMCGTTDPNTCRRNVEQFMFAFDSDLAPVVGQQATLTSPPNSNAVAVGSRITLMLQRAAAGECDVVVKGNFAGVERGWVCTGSGCSGNASFRSDRTGEPFLTDAQLRSQANTAGQELTYTAVPAGSGIRIGIDRDLDGFPDRTELDAGTDPADPASFPSGTTTTTAGGSTTTSTTSTTSTTLPSSGPSKCTGKKFTAAGKKIKRRAKCYGKAVARGVIVDGGCLMSASDRFGATWTKVDSRSDCRTHGDVSSIENLVDGFVDGLATALEPNGTQPSRCTEKKIKVAANKTAAKAKCYAKAATRGVGVDGGCLANASSKFGTSWANLEASGRDCLTTGDANGIENDVDSFVSQLAGDLEP